MPEALIPPDPILRAEATMSWADGLAAMQALSADPAGAVRRAKEAKERLARGAPEPLEFEPDMPGPDGTDGSRALTDDELDQLVVPPPPTLAHDAAWFRTVDTAKPYAGLLRRLRERF